MPLDPSIPLRAISGRRNNLVEEYAQAVNIKNALAQQKAAEAELARQENVRNALSKAVNPQTGEVDWQSAVNTVATVDPMTALSLRGELAKEQASGFDMKAKQIEYYSKAFDQAAQMAPTITDQAGWDSLRQWAYGIDPNLAERIPREFTPQNAQALAMTALDLKDRISIGQNDRNFAAQEAERRRQATRDAARDRFEGIPTADAETPPQPGNPEFYAWLTSVSPSLEDKFNLPRGSVEAMSEVESGHNPDAVSPTGVRGPLQVTDAVGDQMNLDRNDPQQNTYAGAQLMGQLWQKYNDPELVAAAYNSGEDAVDRALQWSKDTGAPWQQSGYVRKEGINHGRKFAAAYQRIQERLAAGTISPKQAQEQTAKLMDKEVEQEFKDETPKATDKFTVLTEEEAVSLGLDPKGKYQRNEAGKIDTIQAPPKAELSPKDINTANQKLIQIGILKKQLAKLKESFKTIQNSWSAGIGTGGIPTEAGQIYDADVNAMRSLIQGLKRVPGVGSMSDYESRLEQSAIPERSPMSTEAKMARQIQNLEDLVTGFETGYTEMLKDVAPAQPAEPTESAGVPSGVKITRIK